MLKSEQPLTKHKVDLVFIRYIENNICFIDMDALAR